MPAIDWAAIWRQHRVNLAGLLAVVLGITLLAWLSPLPDADWQPAEPVVATDDQAELPLAFDDSSTAAFRKLGRWGKSVEEHEQAQAERAARRAAPKAPPPPPRPTFGVLGMVSVGDEQYVLYRSQQGDMQRLKPGELAPDGRRLLGTDDTKVLLTDESGANTAMQIFPPLRASGG